MTMRALKTLENYIPGRTVKAGELFEAASAADARVLALAQLAEEYEPPKNKIQTLRIVRGRMKLLGLEISIAKKAAIVGPVYNGSAYDRGWFPVVQEPFAGAWQRNMPLVMGRNPLQNATLYRCIS